MYNSGIVKAFCVRFTYVIELFWIKISVNFVERERGSREICRILFNLTITDIMSIFKI